MNHSQLERPTGLCHVLSQHPQGGNPMSTEELKAKIRRFMEESYNKGNLGVVDEDCVADFVYHTPPFPDFQGTEAYKQFVAGVRNAYSGVHITVDEVIVEGDTTVFRWTLRGTHTGQSPTIRIPPTGKPVTMTGCGVVHSVGGKYVDSWNYGDYLGLLQQLGVVPSPGRGGQ
jgi:predicted ester cyclase